MKNHFELFSTFTIFYAKVQNQYCVFVKVFWYNNAPKYSSTHTIQFLLPRGILHQYSCSYTTQQNGLAKRKNGHLAYSP